METTMYQLTDGETAAAAVGGLFGLGIGVILTFMLVFWIFQIIAFWKIFTKAGEPGWKSIIPIYNNYIQFKITWKPMWFWVNFVLLLINSIIAQVSEPNALILVISGIVAIALLVLNIVAMVKLSRSFGHGVGFAIGLILLYPIFVLILGYGKSEYEGPDL